jgi:hypothetical protein
MNRNKRPEKHGQGLGNRKNAGKMETRKVQLMDARQEVGMQELNGNMRIVTGGRGLGRRNPGSEQKQDSCNRRMRVRQKELRNWTETRHLQVAGSVSVKSSLLHHRGRPLTTYDLGTVIIIIIIGH